jgi:hypothetical protein
MAKTAKTTKTTAKRAVAKTARTRVAARKTVRKVAARKTAPRKAVALRIAPPTRVVSADKVFAMLKRPNGATKTQIMKVTGWNFGEAYIDRFATKARGFKKVVMDTNHWRVVPRGSRG